MGQRIQRRGVPKVERVQIHLAKHAQDRDPSPWRTRMAHVSSTAQAKPTWLWQGGIHVQFSVVKLACRSAAIAWSCFHCCRCLLSYFAVDVVAVAVVAVVAALL